MLYGCVGAIAIYSPWHDFQTSPNCWVFESCLPELLAAPGDTMQNRAIQYGSNENKQNM